VLCTLKASESPKYCRDVLGLSEPLGSIDRSKLNVKGGIIAIGHPFAATGARIVSALAKILANDPNAKRGLISGCTAGGIGVTADAVGRGERATQRSTSNPSWSRDPAA
jgi:acetyl-CoA C-acetyltransferase